MPALHQESPGNTMLVQTENPEALAAATASFSSPQASVSVRPQPFNSGPQFTRSLAKHRGE